MDNQLEIFNLNSAPQQPVSSAQAYVRPVQTEKGLAYGVFTADGTPLGNTFPSREAAYFTARQHELELVDIH